MPIKHSFPIDKGTVEIQGPDLELVQNRDNSIDFSRVAHIASSSDLIYVFKMKGKQQI